MGEGAVGKSFHHDELTAIIRPGIIALALLLALLPVSGSRASEEFELFDKGYENYLAYHPETAADTFRMFLSEFPQSSARDAALFWLGKSLIGMKAYDEARNVFAGLRQDFPESPFVPHVEREMSALGSTPSPKEAGSSGMSVRSEGARESEQAESERKVRSMEQQLAKEVKERERLGTQLEEEKKRTADMKAKVAEMEKREAESRALFAKGDDEQKRIAIEMEKDRKQLREEREKLDAERRGMSEELRRESRKSEKEDTQAAGAYEGAAVHIRKETYTMRQVIDFMLTSSSAMAKTGIGEVPWRSGDLLDDFVNEQILYGEAAREKVSGDGGKLKELAAKFKLTRDEETYLGRYLAISGLMDRRMGSIPEERVVETLTVHYTDGDKQGKVVLATELQGRARAGKTFEEIAAAFPDRVRFSVTGFQELQGWIKDRIELLKDGEISVVWTKDGYMILRPMMKRPSYRPFEEGRPASKTETRAFVKTWLQDLKKEIKDIEIVRAGQ